MSKFNPFAGGPAYVVALKNALEGQTNNFCEPPRAGGKKQTSIRLDDHISLQIDAISKATGWNQNQILSTFVQHGLFNLYQITDDAVVKKLILDINLNLENMNFANEAKKVISAFIALLSRRNEEIDDWECACLDDAISALREGLPKYALICAQQAMTEKNEQSRDKNYLDIIPKKTKSLEQLKREFEEII